MHSRGGLFNLSFEPLNAHSYTHLHHGSQSHTGWLARTAYLGRSLLSVIGYLWSEEVGHYVTIWKCHMTNSSSHTYIVFNKTI